MEPFKEDVEFLEHFGVKGMKWGVRKQQGASSGGTGKSKKSPNKTSLTRGQKVAVAIIGGPIGYYALTRMRTDGGTATSSKTKSSKQPETPQQKADRVKLTRGEAVTSAILGGPIGYFGLKALRQSQADRAAQND